MNILTYDEFEKVMTGIVNEMHFQDRIYNAFRGTGMNGCYDRNLPTLDTTLMLLDRIFKDDAEYPLIDYWVFELNCGEDWKPNSVTNEDGSSVPLKTISDLYDELVKQYASKEKR